MIEQETEINFRNEGFIDFEPIDEAEAITMTVRAIKGKTNKVISRRDDGKIILFSNIDPLSATIDIGDIVEDKVRYESESFIVLSPISVKKEEVILRRSLTDNEAHLTFGYGGVWMVELSKSFIEEHPNALEEGKPVKVIMLAE
jgi:hypothetical protein